MPQTIDISPMTLDRFRSVLPPERFTAMERAIGEARELLKGRVVWNVNSTARGGGVVELLNPLLAYARGAGVDARWMVIDGTPEFFEITKRIHNRLHGSQGDGGALDDAARNVYEGVLAGNAADFSHRVHEGDIVILHDPQTAGMAKAMHDAGARVVWRCHVGLDRPNDIAREAWAFLRPYVVEADAYVFSREAFVWEGLDHERIVVIPPTIDAFSPKNMDLDPATVGAVLRASGLVSDGEPGPATFRRPDGTPGRIEHQAELFEEARLELETPVVLQVSRWDALKDPLGVIRGFADHVPAATGAHLVYAGPAVEAVSDDPEGERVLHQSQELRASLPAEPRSRIHLATLPMVDPEENAIIVNALQRHARVVVQKSLAEGFGLTVAEAMWKARPVVASRIGGIQDQIVDGETGILIDDPRDLEAFGDAITDLLGNPHEAERIGEWARERVRDEFLSVRSLLDYMHLIRNLVSDGSAAQSSISSKSVTESTTLEAR
jgi:trehalose synthase